METEPQAELEVQEQEVQQDVAPIEELLESQDGQEVQEEVEEKQVPLAALQKERRKRQDAEAKSHRFEVESKFYQEQTARVSQAPAEDDESRYESVTRADLQNDRQATKAEILAAVTEQLRDVSEAKWQKRNKEKYEYVSDNLEHFLTQRPNLASAIKDSSNRYEEAYELMTALSPKQQKQMANPQRKASPVSPTSVPKGAAMNQAIDIMSMSDEEYRDWRKSKRVR